ncbi:hypothetical protein [uncultured Alistipes sp.]|jgi:hypothetical protein|uniref:hypothetical protein n=1 Tax=Alistipes sp. TaxID=1872444 RepID=UPI00266BFB81|nr:hypothetical protein [uncultured Alistipes sp.]
MSRGGFSWKRVTGISGAKSNFSKMTGVPLTKSGRQQKVGRTVSGGCLGIVIVLITPIFLSLLLIIIF